MPKKSILVVDDEISIRKVLSTAFNREGYQVTAVKNAVEAMSVAKESSFDLVIADLLLPDGSGLDLIESLRNAHAQIASIIITGNATVESAIEATKRGVFHYVTKPFNVDEVLGLVYKALRLEQLNLENKHLKQQLNKRYRMQNIIGDSKAICRVYELIEKVADTDSTVLVTGESGTGKELVARALHYSSSRADKLFVPVNCGAIPAGLLESELFGHVRGAFTGAIANRIGRFQAAQSGTLFLDEIGEMSPDLQVKLLRVLQDKHFEPVGSVKPLESDTRIIAATHVDLEDAVLTKRFREDLFYRLNVIPIFVPPLRERKEDMPLLIQHFLGIFNEEKSCDVGISDEEVVNRLMAYDWPGNVRELENLVQRLVILKRSGEIELKDLPPKLYGQKQRVASGLYQFMDFELPESGIDFKSIVNSFEDHLLREALRRTNGNRNKASELLQMNRTTLVEKLKKKQLSL